MNSPTTPFAMSSHQAIMKCPWQWREPFLDEKRASRKRKVGDGYFYDPVDPNFVDHLLPGHAKMFCAELLESDEKEKIQLEIQRLMLKKEQRADRLIYDALFFGGSYSSSSSSSAPSSSADGAASAAGATSAGESESESESESDPNALLQTSGDDASRENMALVDSILLMTKSVDESSLLASPKSVSSPLSPLLDDDDDDEHCLSLGDSNNISSGDAVSDSDDDANDSAPLFARTLSLELVSDNLHDEYFASEDSDLLDFPTTASASE